MEAIISRANPEEVRNKPIIARRQILDMRRSIGCSRKVFRRSHARYRDAHSLEGFSFERDADVKIASHFATII